MASRSENGDLFLACRQGDLNIVKHLVEVREVDVNVYDRWDSTPLYYACLCGHRLVVEYLLQKGARCEANTFDGERCMYGALNDYIRNLLRSYKVLYSFARDTYCEFLSHLRDKEPTDITFIVHGREFHAHRCVLMARSQYFVNRFLGRWYNRRQIVINHPLVNADAFQALLQYIYTAQVEISTCLLHEFERLIKQCSLESACRRLQNKKAEIECFLASKVGVSVSVLNLESDCNELRSAFSRLSDGAIPEELATSVDREMPFREARPTPLHPDVCFVVQGYKFLCHQSFFCARSRYFKALIDNQLCGEELVSLCDDDDENSNFPNEFRRLPLVNISALDVDSFRQILYFVYEDKIYLKDDVESEDLLQLLDKAEMYLLPGLKRQCASYLENLLTPDNIFSCLQAARLFVLPRFEQACYRFMADNLDEIMRKSEFAVLVQDDAVAVQSRQETDSIDVVDQIRYHILRCSETETVKELRLNQLQGLLMELNLEC